MTKFECPECKSLFAKWSTCLEHLRASGHCNGHGKLKMRKFHSSSGSIQPTTAMVLNLPTTGSVHGVDCDPRDESVCVDASASSLESFPVTPLPPPSFTQPASETSARDENSKPGVPEWAAEAVLQWTNVVKKYRQRSPWNVLTLYIVSRKNYKAGKFPPGVTVKEYTAAVLNALKSDPQLENSVDDKGQGCFWLSAAEPTPPRGGPGPHPSRPTAALRGLDRDALLAHAGAEPSALPPTYAQISGIETHSARAGLSDDDAGSDSGSAPGRAAGAQGPAMRSGIAHGQEGGTPGPAGLQALARGGAGAAQPLPPPPQAPARKYYPSLQLAAASAAMASAAAAAAADPVSVSAKDPPASAPSAAAGAPSAAACERKAGPAGRDGASTAEEELLRFFLCRDQGAAPGFEHGCALADRAGAARLKEASLLGTLEAGPEEEGGADMEERYMDLRFPRQRSRLSHSCHSQPRPPPTPPPSSNLKISSSPLHALLFLLPPVPVPSSSRPCSFFPPSLFLLSPVPVPSSPRPCSFFPSSLFLLPASLLFPLFPFLLF